MSRKELVVSIPPGYGRDSDAGRVFKLTEWPAARAEKWAYRLFLAMKGTSAHVDEWVARTGYVGVFVRGLNSFLAADVKFDILEPLLDEMFSCVQVIRDPRRPDIATPLLPDDIEEIRSRAWLRAEVLSLHAGFSVADAMSAFFDLLRTPPQQDSPSMSTSPPPSAQ